MLTIFLLRLLHRVGSFCWSQMILQHVRMFGMLSNETGLERTWTYLNKAFPCYQAYSARNPRYVGMSWHCSILWTLASNDFWTRGTLYFVLWVSVMQKWIHNSWIWVIESLESIWAKSNLHANSVAQRGARRIIGKPSPRKVQFVHHLETKRPSMGMHLLQLQTSVGNNSFITKAGMSQLEFSLL